MNDTMLADAVKSGLTEVCDSLSTVRLAIPASEIMARADQARRRRRQGVLAGAGAGAGAGGLAAAVMAVSMALPASHPAASHPAASHPAASHPASGPGVQLTAWTVTRPADGTIQVTFREATDAAGLQRTLRADGVPVSVTFTGRQNPACQPHSPGSRQALWPVGPGTGPLDGSSFIHDPKASYNTPDALVIHPSALQSGAGLQIWTSGTPERQTISS